MTVKVLHYCLKIPGVNFKQRWQGEITWLNQGDFYTGGCAFCMGVALYSRTHLYSCYWNTFLITRVYLTKTDVSAFTSAVIATVTNNNRIIGLGDQTDDHTNHHVDTRTTINRANQETVNNLTNRRVTRSVVRQGLAQL